MLFNDWKNQVKGDGVLDKINFMTASFHLPIYPVTLEKGKIQKLSNAKNMAALSNR